MLLTPFIYRNLHYNLGIWSYERGNYFARIQTEELQKLLCIDSPSVLSINILSIKVRLSSSICLLTRSNGSFPVLSRIEVFFYAIGHKMGFFEKQLFTHFSFIIIAHGLTCLVTGFLLKFYMYFQFFFVTILKIKKMRLPLTNCFCTQMTANRVSTCFKKMWLKKKHQNMSSTPYIDNFLSDTFFWKTLICFTVSSKLW